MTVKMVGVASEMARIKKEIKAIKKEGGEAVADAALAALSSYIWSTPVWSGEAVRNYKIGVGSPPTAKSAPVGGKIAYPGPVPAGVANEGRRAANQSAAFEQAKAALNKVRTGGKFFGETVFIKNTVGSGKADLIENGSAPTPQKSRYSGGLTPRAQQAATAGGRGTVS